MSLGVIEFLDSEKCFSLKLLSFFKKRNKIKEESTEWFDKFYSLLNKIGNCVVFKLTDLSSFVKSRIILYGLYMEASNKLGKILDKMFFIIFLNLFINGITSGCSFKYF